MKTSLHLLRIAALGLTSAAVLTFSSCTPVQQQGAGISALGDGALGAIFGDDSDDVVRAAAIKESNDRKAGKYNRGGDQLAPPAPKPKKTSRYPLATPIAGTTNQVISPYPPHNVIDVKGFRTGQLARDPSTAPIGPDGKPDISKAKIFEMP